ncbi:MAG: hypothetical protein WCX88_03370 [Patescibacteria group bacterium]
MGKFNFSCDDFDKIKNEAEEFYTSICKIHCPYFGEEIIFNSKGLKHLKFKADRIARPQKDQYARLKLLSFAPKVLKKSHTVQGVYEIKRFEEQKINSKWKNILKDVIYYEFIAVIDSVRVKVIVKEVFGGEKHFWSIIPFWGIDKENSKRILHSGNPEKD